MSIASVTAGFTWAPEKGAAKHTVAKKKRAKNSSDPCEQMILTLFVSITHMQRVPYLKTQTERFSLLLLT